MVDLPRSTPPGLAPKQRRRVIFASIIGTIIGLYAFGLAFVAGPRGSAIF